VSCAEYHGHFSRYGCQADRHAFQLVSQKCERGSMIITSNKSFTERGGVLGDKGFATAILDRLLHNCDVIINGPSYRLKDRLTLV
jgi:DNA replication protein DnaC